MVIDLIAALPGVSCSRFPRKHGLAEGLLELKADPNIIQEGHLTKNGRWVKRRTLSIPACSMESPPPDPPLWRTAVIRVSVPEQIRRTHVFRRFG